MKLFREGNDGVLLFSRFGISFGRKTLGNWELGGGRKIWRDLTPSLLQALNIEIQYLSLSKRERERERERERVMGLYGPGSYGMGLQCGLENCCSECPSWASVCYTGFY